MPTRQRAASPQLAEGALKHHFTTVCSSSGTQIDDVVGDTDHLWLVLHHEYRVALVPKLEQEGVHALDVVRVQPDRRLVEDVGDVGE